jgi:hypothetical protein
LNDCLANAWQGFIVDSLSGCDPSVDPFIVAALQLQASLFC